MAQINIILSREVILQLLSDNPGNALKIFYKLYTDD